METAAARKALIRGAALSSLVLSGTAWSQQQIVDLPAESGAKAFPEFSPLGSIRVVALDGNWLRTLPLSGNDMSAAEQPAAPPGAGEITGQSTPAGDTTEIVVTAQRREQSLIDVPAAITAIGGDMVKRLNVTSMPAIAQQVPSFTVTYERGTNTTPTFNLRGIQGDGLASRLNESSIAIYTDDVYLGDENMLNGALFDLRRVEVLRGPQGTLFGKNTTGGLVNFISETPTSDFAGYATALYGSDNATTVEGAVSGAVANGLRARIAGSWDRNEGHYRNVYLGAGRNGVPKKLGARDIWAVRGTIDADLGPNTLLRVTGFHSENHSQSTPVYILGTLQPGTTGNPPYSRAQMCSLDQILDAECIAVVQVQGGLPNSESGPGLSSTDLTAHDLRATGETNALTARLTHDFGAAKLTSITNYTKNRFLEGLETSQISPSIVSTDNPLYTSRFNKAHQFSEEIRMNGSRKAFDWVLGGLYYTDSKYHHLFASITGAPILLVIDTSVQSHSYAMFGQLDNHLTEQLTLSVGGRYTIDHRALTQASTANDANHAGSFQDIRAYLEATGRPTSSDTNDFTGKFGLTLKPSDDASYYLSFSRGIKGEGFNAGFSPFNKIAVNAALAGPVGQEILDAVEIGAKNRLFDRKLSINTAAFFYNYKGKQVSLPIYDPVTKTAAYNYINVGTAHVYGIETEVLFRPSRNFDFTASGSLLRSKITKSDVSTPDAFGVITSLQGKRLVATPDWTFNAIPAYHVFTGGMGVFTLQAEVNGLGRRSFSAVNDPLSEDPAHVLVNLRLLWASSNGRYTAQAFVTNLFKEQQLLDARDTVLSALGAQPILDNESRLWGLKLGTSF